MSAALPGFNLLRPATINAAVSALQTQPSPRLCAGGTDLIVNMRRGLVAAETLIDLTGIPELKTIKANDQGLRIGAGVILRDLAENQAITAAYPAINQAVLSVAGPTHRAAATVGGNLCLDTRCLYYNQSHWWRKSNDFCLKYRGDICHVAPSGNRCRAAFSGDLAPALMVLDAQIEIAGPNGVRQMTLSDLYREDGMDHLTLDKTEIVTAAHVPPPRGRSAYAKLRVRGAIEFPLAGVAIACDQTADGARRLVIAITGTNSMPVMVPVADLPKDGDIAAFQGRLSKAVQKAVSPQRTSTTAPHYRRLAIAALAVRLARGLI